METIKKEEDKVVGSQVENEEHADKVVVSDESLKKDLEEEYNKLIAENAKLSKERDNYKKGMLLAKGKIVENDEEHTSLPLEEQIEKIVQEKLLATQEAQNLMKQKELVERALKENKELKLALANRKQVDNSSVGTGSSEPIPVKDNFLSPAQINDLKSKGWDDKKIELFRKNLAKAV
jgi:hypothetical protein